jgi:hypothetical protein
MHMSGGSQLALALLWRRLLLLLFLAVASAAVVLSSCVASSATPPSIQAPPPPGSRRHCGGSSSKPLLTDAVAAKCGAAAAIADVGRGVRGGLARLAVSGQWRRNLSCARRHRHRRCSHRRHHPALPRRSAAGCSATRLIWKRPVRRSFQTAWQQRSVPVADATSLILQLDAAPRDAALLRRLHPARASAAAAGRPFCKLRWRDACMQCAELLRSRRQALSRLLNSC